MASAGLEADITTENTHVKLSRSLPLGALKFYQSNHLEVKEMLGSV